MRRMTQSPAILFAVAALVAALAGTALAGPTATTSSTKKTAKKALKKAKKAGKTAATALESAGAAQSAAAAAQTSADSAQTSADSAQTDATTALGRSDRFSYSTDATAATSSLLARDGLLLQGHCLTGNLNVEAVSQANNSMIHVGTILTAANTTSYAEDDDFDSGDSVSLNAGGGTDNIQGTFTFRNGQNGKIVTSTYLLEEETPLDCNAFGTLAVE
jgi:hypothetical protein